MQSEAAFQRQVISLARLNGWRIAHFRPAQRADGTWRTPVSADGAGFPDLVLVRERVLFVELKSARGALSKAQIDWRCALADACAEVYCWQPADWDSIVVVLGKAAA